MKEVELDRYRTEEELLELVLAIRDELEALITIYAAALQKLGELKNGK